ncbi:MAG TPA: APC family permease [Rhizomicrobium sp.]|nr:APC family permease [Rhizomicrobium sp.]
MRLMGVTLLTLSSITPATSVFVIVPGVFQQAGTGALISMAAIAVVSLFTAYVYAELSSAFPIAGGEYSMVGKTIGPAAGFATLTLTALSNMLQPAVFSLGAAAYIKAVLPGVDATAVGIAIIVITTLLGVLHIRTNAWITGTFLALELMALVVLTVLGFSHISQPLSEFVHPVMLSGNALRPTPLAMIGLSGAAAIFAYQGYGSAVYFAEEMHEAPRVVARTIMLTLFLAVATEIVPVAAVLMGAPDMKALLGADSPFTFFVEKVGGRWLSIAVSLGIAIAIFNAVLATVMQNGRFFFSTGRDETWHGLINEAFVRTHPQFNSPWIATIVSGLTGIAACFIDNYTLLVLTGTGIVFVYGALCISALVGRRQGSTDHAVYRMPFFPLVPLLGLAALGFVLVTSIFDAKGRLSLVVNLGVVIAALVYYRLVLARRGTWVLRGPEDEHA